MLHLIGTLDRPVSGAVRIAGYDVAALSDRQLSALRARPDRLRLPAVPPGGRGTGAGQRRRRPALLPAYGLRGAAAPGGRRAGPGGPGAPAATTGRTSCPAASSSGSPSPGRWSASRRCCWPTSRPATWTRRPARGCLGCCASCTRPARPSGHHPRPGDRRGAAPPGARCATGGSWHDRRRRGQSPGSAGCAPRDVVRVGAGRAAHPAAAGGAVRAGHRHRHRRDGRGGRHLHRPAGPTWTGTLAALGTNLLTGGARPDPVRRAVARCPTTRSAMIGRIGPVTSVTATGAVTDAHVYRNDQIPPARPAASRCSRRRLDLLGHRRRHARQRRLAQRGHRRGTRPWCWAPARPPGSGSARRSADILVWLGGALVHRGRRPGTRAAGPRAGHRRAGRLAGRGRPCWPSTATRRPSTPGPATTRSSAVQAVLGGDRQPGAPERGEGVATRPTRWPPGRPPTRRFTGLLLGLGAVALLVGGVGRGQHDGHLGAGAAGGDRAAPLARRHPRADPAAVPRRVAAAVGARRGGRSGAGHRRDDRLRGGTGLAVGGTGLGHRRRHRSRRS